MVIAANSRVMQSSNSRSKPREIVCRGEGFATGFGPDGEAFTTTEEGFALVEIASDDAIWSIPDQEVLASRDPGGDVAFTKFGALQFYDGSNGTRIGPRVNGPAEEGLKSETLYGPTRRHELVGPIDENSIQDLVLNQEDAARLWTISEEKTSLSWSL